MALDWQVFCKSTLSGDTAEHCLGSLVAAGGDVTYLQWLFSAWGWTLAVATLGLLIALVIGVLVGTLRTLPQRPLLVALATCWVELFRNIPLLVQVFLWYHVAPVLLPALKGLSSYLLVSIALGFFTSARIAEQVRAGIQALPVGQRLAALALGLDTWQTYRFVIGPAALRIILPPLTSEAMNIIKNSSVAFAVSVAEMTLFAMQAQEETSRGIEIYLAVTTLYMLSALLVSLLMGRLEKRLRLPGSPALALAGKSAG